MLPLADPPSKNDLHLFYKEYSEAQILCQADPLTRQKAPMVGLDMRRWSAHDYSLKKLLEFVYLYPLIWAGIVFFGIILLDGLWQERWVLQVMPSIDRSKANNFHKKHGKII